MRERKNTITRTIQEEDNNRKEEAKMEKRKKQIERKRGEEFATSRLGERREEAR